MCVTFWILGVGLTWGMVAKRYRADIENNYFTSDYILSISFQGLF